MYLYIKKKQEEMAVLTSRYEVDTARSDHGSTFNDELEKSKD